MSTPPKPESPLLRFPAEVQAAYQDFRLSGDEAALRTVVLAAVRDFMPKGGVRQSPAELQPEQRLIEDLGYDSLAVAEIVFFFEDLFKVTIRNEDILTLRTVGELCAFVSRRLRETASAA